MSHLRATLLFASLGAALLGCAEDPAPIVPDGSGAYVVATPGGLVTRHDRCAYAVARVAAVQFDCTPDDIEVHPVGPSAFLTSGCDAKLGTFFCDEVSGQARVVRQR